MQDHILEERFSSIDENFTFIKEHFNRIDEKFEQIDQRFEQIDQRFNGIDSRINRLESGLLTILEIVRSTDVTVKEIKVSLINHEKRLSILERRLA